MQRHAANGDRHAALRQFERLDKALRRELGVAPGRAAVELRDRLLADHDVAPSPPDEMVGRDRELGVAERALEATAAGREPDADHQRAGRDGQVVDAVRAHPPGPGAGPAHRAGDVGAGRGGVALRAGRRGDGRPLPPPPDPARRAGRPAPRGDRPGPGRRGDVVVRRELAPAPVRGHGRAGPARRGDERPAADLRRRPRRRRLQPAPAALRRPGDA